MNYHTHLETTCFKVKDPEKFEGEVKQYICGESVELISRDDGFVLYASDATDLRYEEDITVIDPIANMIQMHLIPDQEVIMTYISLSDKYTDLSFSMFLVKPHGIYWRGNEGIYEELLVEATRDRAASLSREGKNDNSN